MKLPSSLSGVARYSITWRKRFIYQAQRFALRLGKTGISALALVVCSATVWITSIAPLYHQQTPGNETSDSIPLSQGDAAHKKSVALSAFHELIPDKPKPASIVGKLHEIAEKSGLRLKDIDLQTTKQNDLRRELPGITVTLDCSANHETIIKFINAVLLEMPFAALESLVFKRANVTDPLVDTQLRFRMSSKAP